MVNVSVITVCYNAENTISKTMLSVLNQNYSDYEYIIIDGDSSDKTLSIINEIKNKHTNKWIEVISEKDRGIYDAMNKGIKMASGKWIIFMNSGDLFYDSSCLDKFVKAAIVNAQADIIYGDTILKDGEYYKFHKAKEIESIVYEMPFCHQSVFTKKKLLLNSPYDLTYKICADYNFYLKQYTDKICFARFDYPISVYEVVGFSGKNNGLDFWKEKYDIQYKYGYLTEKESKANYLNRFNEINSIVAKIKRMVPQGMKKRHRIKMLVRSGWEKRLRLK